MANNQEHWKSITNILLSAIGGLLVFFGTITVSILTKLVEKVEVVKTVQAVQENEQANIKSDLKDMKREVSEMKPYLSRLYGKVEDEDQFKPRSK